MDIKLNARLCAYSKADSVGGTSTLPLPEGADNSVVGVQNDGYTFFQTVEKSAIDGLFQDVAQDSTVTKPEIDTLFENSTENCVSKTSIDSLF